MPFDDDDDKDEDGRDEGHHHNPLESFLANLFGGGPTGPKFDAKAEKAAFERAKFTAVRAAKTIMAPQRQTKNVFTDHLRERVYGPLLADPLVTNEDVHRLLEALETPTGQIRESDQGRPPRPEVWADTLHDTWFGHLAEHVAYNLWLRLKGTPDEKEAMLDEMIPVLEKYGIAIIHTFRAFDQPPDDEGNSPIVAAARCATASIKGMIVEKAQELGVGPYGLPPGKGKKK
jgi:hypothetical protein